MGSRDLLEVTWGCAIDSFDLDWLLGCLPSTFHPVVVLFTIPRHRFLLVENLVSSVRTCVSLETARLPLRECRGVNSSYGSQVERLMRFLLPRSSPLRLRRKPNLFALGVQWPA